MPAQYAEQLASELLISQGDRLQRRIRARQNRDRQQALLSTFAQVGKLAARLQITQ
ncbi:MAG: hypothetical protein J2P36_09150 [Ktedonobacteraceae bacterium]|nr:hypothetical protein [Ktedonobacteraceae bacterium]